MILYLTSQEHTNLLDFLAGQKEAALPVKKITGKFMLRQFVIHDMRNFSHCKELVLDRQAFGDDDAAFVEAVTEFLTMYNARVTVICEGLKEQSFLFRGLLEAGVGNIVTGTEIGKIQSQICQSLEPEGMAGYGSGKGTEQTKEQEAYRFKADGVKIAVAGSQNRMGITTAALGLTAWLGSVGATVCYVERDGSGIISSLAEAYGMQPLNDGFQLENVWYGERIPEEECQFAVIDYGTCRTGEADLLLLVCGTRPYELAYTMEFLQQYEERYAFVLCPFVEESLRMAYAEALCSERHKVLFLEYQPDCMDGSPNRKAFKEIIEKYIAGE